MRSGGEPHTLRELCLLRATIDGYTIQGDAYVIDALGHDDLGRPIDILIGALLMQKWCIRPVPDEERLDWTYYFFAFNEFSVTPA